MGHVKPVRSAGQGFTLGPQESHGRMSLWILGVALFGLVEAQLNLDCARPTAARRLIGQARLSEIEWVEDVNRAAMWDAFGRCATLPEPETCRNQERRRFEADLDRQRAVIEAKYRKMLEEFEQRCQASITYLVSGTISSQLETNLDAPSWGACLSNAR
jgi:hypothetical protein